MPIVKNILRICPSPIGQFAYEPETSLYVGADNLQCLLIVACARDHCEVEINITIVFAADVDLSGDSFRVPAPLIIGSHVPKSVGGTCVHTQDV